MQGFFEKLAGSKIFNNFFWLFNYFLTLKWQNALNENSNQNGLLLSKGKRTVAPLTNHNVSVEKRTDPSADLLSKPLEVKVIKHSDGGGGAAGSGMEHAGGCQSQNESAR